MAGLRLEGNTSGNVAEVSTAGQLKVVPETDASTNADFVGALKAYHENDDGKYTGEKHLMSAEVDVDYRQRVAHDLILDEEVFSYTAQNTGKHSYANTTMTNNWAAGQLTTNNGSTTNSATGTVVSTYAWFPLLGTSQVSVDVECGFSALPVTNTFIEFGIGIPGAQTAAPSDGIFVRVASNGVQGVASNNGTETSVDFPLLDGAGNWLYTPNSKYQFIIYASAIEAEFWLNDGSGAYLMAKIPLPTAQARMTLGPTGQFFIKHRITGGAAGGVIQGQFGAYNIRLGGPNLVSRLAEQNTRILGNYQGMSGGTMGSLARIGTITSGNEANPAAAVPTTTTAALGTGLGGTFWETASLAVNTDGIIMSYQVPAGTINAAGRRLRLTGIGVSSYVQTVIAGGPFMKEWFIAFGHTAVSLATVEAATTKAPRRVPLPIIQQVTAAQAVGTLLAQNQGYISLDDYGIIVNPGEFIQLCTRHIGTVGTSGTIVHKILPVYSWE